MTFVAEVGDAVQTRGELTIEWKLRDFFSLSNEVDDEYRSPVFNFADTWWHLSLYPNGQAKHSSSGWVGLYLKREDSGPPKHMNFTVGIKGSGGVQKKEECEAMFSKKEKGWGLPECWSRSELRDRKSTLLPDNVLTITFDLKSNAPTASVSSSNRVWKVIRNLKKVLDDGNRADFTLKLGDRKWCVHKVILETRCEYFKNMFRHEWVENVVGEVKFDDIEDDALDSILDFVYTGDVKDMSIDNVCEIYVSAHKFLLDDLKVLCIGYIKGNMCVEIVCKVLVIADTYDEKELNESAIEYFSRAARKIFDTEEWKQLKKNHLSIAAELLEETARRK